MSIENQVDKKCLKDCFSILFVLIAMWTVLTIVIFNIRDLVESNTLRLIITTTGILVGAFATSSSLAVINHLRKNKNNLYQDEIKEERL